MKRLDLQRLLDNTPIGDVDLTFGISAAQIVTPVGNSVSATGTFTNGELITATYNYGQIDLESLGQLTAADITAGSATYTLPNIPVGDITVDIHEAGGIDYLFNIALADVDFTDPLAPRITITPADSSATAAFFTADALVLASYAHQETAVEVLAPIHIAGEGTSFSRTIDEVPAPNTTVSVNVGGVDIAASMVTVTGQTVDVTGTFTTNGAPIVVYLFKSILE